MNAKAVLGKERAYKKDKARAFKNIFQSLQYSLKSEQLLILTLTLIFLLDDVVVCTRITTEEAMITDTINVQQMLYIFLYSFSRSENLEFLTQWYWVV